MEEKIPRKWGYLLVFLVIVAAVVASWRALREPPISLPPAAPLPEPSGATREAPRRSEELLRAIERENALLRGELADTQAQIRHLKAELLQAQRDLSTARERLDQARRERDEFARAAVPSSPRESPAARAPEAREAASPPKQSEQAGSLLSPADPGTYETLRTTLVFEEPSRSSRTVATIGPGTRVTVVGSRGEWLEVRSKHGKPPGFVRREDAMFLKSGN
jgi:hypothetical protein